MNGNEIICYIYWMRIKSITKYKRKITKLIRQVPYTDVEYSEWILKTRVYVL